MSTEKGGIYQRGSFWLDYVRGAGGKPASDRWYIWWYDAAAGRLQRASTGTADVRLACDKLDEHYLAMHRPTVAEQAAYTVSDALTDYWIEHGQHRTSASAIKARLKLLSRFMDAEADAGRLTDPFLPDQVDNRFLERFRSWAARDPIVARRKNQRGEWIDGAKRPRTASTTEESVIQLKAALNHAFNERRVRYVPPLKHRTRDQVTPERTYRLSIEGLAELVDFSFRGAGNYAGHPERLLPLRRYLVAAICTLARPDAIFDMSVDPVRGQWMVDERLFALNPVGRIQTKKYRPVLPIVDLLQASLAATDEWFICSEKRWFGQDGVPVTIQSKVASIKSGWDSARKALGIPTGWGPKLVRHSMATILANERVDLVELEIALGHRVLRKTTSRYAIFAPDYLGSVRDGIESVIVELTKRVAAVQHAKNTQKMLVLSPLRIDQSPVNPLD